jgi:hypothetical protein
MLSYMSDCFSWSYVTIVVRHVYADVSLLAYACCVCGASVPMWAMITIACLTRVIVVSGKSVQRGS